MISDNEFRIIWNLSDEYERDGNIVWLLENATNHFQIIKQTIRF